MAVHLVTGGSGFVGSNTARLLRERGEEVRILDIWRDESQHSDIEFETVQFRAQLARALAGEGDPPRLEFRDV